MPPIIAMMLIPFDNISNSLNNSEGTLVSVDVVPKTKTKTKTKSESSNLPQRQRQSKKVHFKSSVKVRKISTHRNYTQEERAAVWFSAVESKAIKKAVVATVKKMYKGIDVDADENDCSRGLECKTPQKNKIRQTRRKDIMCIVMIEQQIQNEEGRVDAQDLADAYMQSNQSCIAEAINRGAKDEFAAREET
jgi:hypothetical protein